MVGEQALKYNSGAEDHNKDTAQDESVIRWEDIAKVPYAGDQLTEENNPDVGVESAAEAEHQSPSELVKAWSAQYYSTEIDFERYAKTVKLETTDQKTKYRENLLRYEDDAKYDWTRMEEFTSEAIDKGEIHYGRFDVVNLQGIRQTNELDPAKSIEAATGIFFKERTAKLDEAIRLDRRIPDEEREKRLRLVGQAWLRLEDFFEAVENYDLLREQGDHAYNVARRNAHNTLIQQLNVMNDLAESYGTERLTFRNFMTNDTYDERAGMLDGQGALRGRMEYDRDTVIGYFEQAFTDDFARHRERFERKTRFF